MTIETSNDPKFYKYLRIPGIFFLYVGLSLSAGGWLLVVLPKEFDGGWQVLFGGLSCFVAGLALLNPAKVKPTINQFRTFLKGLTLYGSLKWIFDNFVRYTSGALSILFALLILPHVLIETKETETVKDLVWGIGFVIGGFYAFAPIPTKKFLVAAASHLSGIIGKLIIAVLALVAIVAVIWGFGRWPARHWECLWPYRNCHSDRLIHYRFSNTG